MLYEKTFKTLNKGKIPYVVIGGIAVNLHGFSRATGDLDIVISIEDEAIQAFVKVIKKMGYMPRLPVKMEDFANKQKRDEWIYKKNMKVFSVYNPKNPLEHIDIMTENLIPFKKLYEHRVIMSQGTLNIPVASIPDIIKLKKIAGRERDQIDIKALKKIYEIQNKK